MLDDRKRAAEEKKKNAVAAERASEDGGENEGGSETGRALSADERKRARQRAKNTFDQGQGLG